MSIIKACYDCVTLTFQTHTHTHRHGQINTSGLGEVSMINIAVIIFIVNPSPVSVLDLGIMQRPEHRIFAKNYLAMMSY